MIRRLGNKSKIIDLLFKYFPPHTIYVEPFFGSGSVFFRKPLSKYNHLNDLDANISLCYNFLKEAGNADLLVEAIELIPYCDMVWRQLKESRPKTDIDKIIKFLYISNFGYLGLPETLKIGNENSKVLLLKNIKKTYKRLCNSNIEWQCKDFEAFFNAISLRSGADLNNAFCYCDPPYLHTTDNYDTPKWEVEDFVRLIETNIAKGWRFAISEFESPQVLDIAERYNLNVYLVKERRNLNNRRVEILITNYDARSGLFHL